MDYDVARFQTWRDGWAVWNEKLRKFEIRQWYFSASSDVGIAAQILAESRTPGFAIALFRSIEIKSVVSKREIHYESYLIPKSPDVYGGATRGSQSKGILLGNNFRGGIDEVAEKEVLEVGSGP